MALPRRETVKSAQKRELILDATEQIIREDGYAAVSSRSVAARVGMNGPLIHYYFPTMDDLFIAMLRRGAARSYERLAAALASPQPLRGLWEIDVNPERTAVGIELAVAANHRKALRAELAEVSTQLRRMHVEALTQLLRTYEINAEDFPAEFMAVAMTGIAHVLVNEATFGATAGHAEARDTVERLIARLERPRAR
jgi:AcrR family transcriptional regulator